MTSIEDKGPLSAQNLSARNPRIQCPGPRLATEVRALVAAAVLAFSTAAFPVGPNPAVAEETSRVVIAGGDLTEIAFALGAGDRIIAVDTTSSYPPAVGDLPKVGYMRRLAPEGLLSMAPDLVLAAAGSGPEATLDRLEQAGVDVRIGPDDRTLSVVSKKIRFVGEALGLEEEAEALVADVEARLEQAIAEAAREDGPKVLFLMTSGRSGLMSAGDGTSAEAIINLSGGRNALTGIDGFKPISAEAALAAQPDVLLVPSHAAVAMGGAETLLDRPELAATPAGRAKRIVVIDSLLLLGFGPRTPEAVKALATALKEGEDA
ncbi:MAG: ABC transporter substrate-binding protein [Pseudomonadota bacterium]